MKITKENGYIKYSIDDMDENTLVIDMVETYKRGQGTATELINEVIKIAEEENKNLELCAYPQDETITLEELVAIYEHLGFVEDYNNNEEALMHYEA